MSNQNKGQAEQFVLRGNADIVIRQLVDEYNSANGWQVNRIVNNILNFTVVLERNTKQGVAKDTSKAVPTEKVVDAGATASDEQLKPSTGTTQPLETKEVDGETSTSEKPVAVKTTRKSANKG